MSQVCTSTVPALGETGSAGRLQLYRYYQFLLMYSTGTDLAHDLLRECTGCPTVNIPESSLTVNIPESSLLYYMLCVQEPNKMSRRHLRPNPLELPNPKVRLLATLTKRDGYNFGSTRRQVEACDSTVLKAWLQLRPF